MIRAPIVRLSNLEARKLQCASAAILCSDSLVYPTMVGVRELPIVTLSIVIAVPERWVKVPLFSCGQDSRQLLVLEFSLGSHNERHPVLTRGGHPRR